MKLPIKPRMPYPSVDRAPWRFLEPDSGVGVVGGSIVWTFPEAGRLPTIYSPGRSAVDVHRNLASIADDTTRIPIVAATLGPLKSEIFRSGHREPLAMWMDAAEQMRTARDLLEAGKLDPLSDLITDNIFDHGRVRVFSDGSDWYFDFADLIGFAWFETAEDMFGVIAGKPRAYAQCPVCTRWYRMLRKDQKQCSTACTSKAHRDRKDEA